MIYAARSLRGLTEDLCRGTRFDHKLYLQFENYRMLLESNAADLVENLRHYFEAFVVSSGEVNLTVTALETATPEIDSHFEIKVPDPGKDKIKEEFLDLDDGRIVRKRLTGMVFMFAADVNLVAGPCCANANQVVNFINNRFIAYKLDQGCLLGHAAAVAKGGRGLALAGFSGMGKSTLALHLMSRGSDFISNDRLLIEGEAGEKLFMHGIAKLPRINPGTALGNPDLTMVMPLADRERFGLLESDELWQVEHKYDVYIDQCFGRNRFQSKASLEALVILNWERQGGALVVAPADENRRRALLPAFMKAAGLFYLGTAEVGLETYLRRLSSCRIYELRGGVDFVAATEFCLRLLE
ncbi:MAG: HprK-related kinase B [Deltaproteobacteria bacterium]|nr:HprK-related kinase B [Deltaproteobacteria bacterium]